MGADFPTIRDSENVLVGDCSGPQGGITTIKAPTYAVAVTETDEDGGIIQVKNDGG